MFGVKSVVSPHRAEPETASRLYAAQSTLGLLRELKLGLHYFNRFEVSYQGLALLPIYGSGMVQPIMTHGKGKPTNAALASGTDFARKVDQRSFHQTTYDDSMKGGWKFNLEERLCQAFCL